MFEAPVVFVDIETTGGSYRYSRVLEVAAVRYENGEIVREFSRLLNPGGQVPAPITALTGITTDDVANAPSFDDIADELHDIFDGAIFIAHNVRFDYSFLRQEFAQCGIDFNPKLLCTVRLSRALYAYEKGHSLEKIIHRHNIPVSARHRAMADVEAMMYFTQLAYEEHGTDAFQAAIAKQLKTQSLPPHLAAEELESIENIPGVYIFKDEAHQPVYIGKSVQLKKRVLSHFTDSSPKEQKIAQRTHHIETISTGSELGALIMESRLIKQHKPIYNRLLRRVRRYALFVRHDSAHGYATIKIEQGTIDPSRSISMIYGVFETRTKARKRLEELTRTFELCPKLMGYEKTNAACFSYSLRRCRGACIGKESAELYNRRFELALTHHRIAAWPYRQPIRVPINAEGEQVILDQWIVRGFISSEGEPVYEDLRAEFDIDEYKILRRFLSENRHMIQLLPQDSYQLSW